MNKVLTIFDTDPQLASPPHSRSASKNHEKSILDKIWRIAKIILIELAGAAMFATNPTLFTLGFISGIIWDTKVEEIIDKIKSIWRSQTWGVLLLTGIASFLALQVTWAAGSVLYAANLGRLMIQRANFWDDTSRMRVADGLG